MNRLRERNERDWKNQTFVEVMNELRGQLGNKPVNMETLMSLEQTLGMVSDVFGVPKMDAAVIDGAAQIKWKGQPLIRTGLGQELDNTQEVEMFCGEVAGAEEWGFFVRVWWKVDWLKLGTKEILEKSSRKPDIVLRNVTGVHYMLETVVEGVKKGMLSMNSDIHEAEFEMELNELDLVEIGVEDEFRESFYVVN